MAENSEQNQAVESLEKPVGLEMLEKTEKEPEEKVVIYTMPKRFVPSSLGSDRAKKVGLLIMAGGIVFLLITAVVLYFFFLRPEIKVIPEQENNLNTEKPNPSASIKPAEEAAPDSNSEKEQDEIIKIEDLNSENNAEVSGEESVPEEGEGASEIEEEVEAATSTPEATTEESVSLERKSAPDTDSDGLSDIEETSLGSIASLRDSDSDGYEDLAEVLGLYNPTGSGSLMVNPNIEKYTNEKFGYSLYYLKKQSIEKVGAGDDSVMFKFDNGHFIQIVAADNASNLSIEEWYKSQFDAQTIRNDQILYKKGWTGVRSEDGLIAYLARAGDDKIYTIAYALGADYVVSYRSIFELFINSFEVK